MKPAKQVINVQISHQTPYVLLAGCIRGFPFPELQFDEVAQVAAQGEQTDDARFLRQDVGVEPEAHVF